MKIGTNFEEIVENKYKEMKENNISEDFLNKEVLGELMIFIGKKPKYVLFSKNIGADLVCVGSESM